jgi:hypothetical protein
VAKPGSSTSLSRAYAVLTDIQFWVPLGVLIGGLFLLHFLF